MRIREVLYNALMVILMIVSGCTLRDVQGFDMRNGDSLYGDGGILADNDLLMNEMVCQYQPDGPGFCKFDCDINVGGRMRDEIKDCKIDRRPSSLFMSISGDRKQNSPDESPVLRGCLCRILLGSSGVPVNDGKFETEFDFDLEHAIVEENGVDGGVVDKGRLLMFVRKADFVDKQNTIIDYRGGLIDARSVKIAGTVNLPNAAGQNYLYVSLSSDRINACPQGKTYCNKILKWTLRNLKIADLKVP